MNDSGFILAVGPAQIILCLQMQRKHCKTPFCNAACFHTIPLYIYFYFDYFIVRIAWPLAFCIHGDKSVSICFVNKYKKKWC